MTGKNVIKAAIDKMTELDAAGWALVLLRCDREADIRRTVEGYVHIARYAPRVKTADWQKKAAEQPILNIKEVTAMGTVKRYGVPFNWQEHAPQGGDISQLDHGAEPALLEQLVRCTDPATALEHRLIFFPSLYDIVGKPETARTALQQQILFILQEISVLKRRRKSNALIILGCTDGLLCEELREYLYVLDIDYPDREELRQILYDACEQCAGRASGLEPAVVDDLAEVLRGMREDDVRNIIHLAYAQCENPLESRAKRLFEAAKDAKRQRIAGVRGLRWIDNDKPLEVGGFDALKEWLDDKKMTFLYPHAAKIQQARAPKGLLLVGLPGCGKTHLAKQTARLLSDGKGTVPLLQMDLNSMLGKWLGEAEANCSMALRAVESVAPAVLLVDEIEKVFGGVTDGGSNDAMMHIFASFLDWMQQEREKPILVIATANKTERLPPELKRKGRFDETFFSGVPVRKDCEAILRIHLKKKRDVLATDGQDAKALDRFCDGILRHFFDRAAQLRRFVNGADIETIVESAFCSLFARYAASALLHDDEGDIERRRYAQDEVEQALERELRSTRSYFDNNLQTTAQYWMEMAQLHFRDAGTSSILNEEQFIPETGMFKDLNLPADPAGYRKEALSAAQRRGQERDYDGALQYTLAAEICKQIHWKGENQR